MTDRVTRQKSEELIEQEKEFISKIADKNQRLSWRRREKKMKELLEKLEPLETKALEIIKKKQPIMDEIEKVRKQMVKDCIHPEDQLARQDNHYICKFCLRKLGINVDISENG